MNNLEKLELATKHSRIITDHFRTTENGFELLETSLVETGIRITVYDNENNIVTEVIDFNTQKELESNLLAIIIKLQNIKEMKNDNR